MRQVYSLSQKKIVNLPDEEESVSMNDGTSAISQPSQPTVTAATQPETPAVEQPKTITGRTIEEHAQALNQAKAANDTGAIKQITDDFDREYAYQKDFVKGEQSDIKKKAEGEKAVSGLLNTLDELKADAADIGLGNIPGRLIGADTKLQQFETKRSLAAQFLAKAVENGRLSDKDRLFYQKIVGIDPYGFTSPKNEQIDELIDTISGLTGVQRQSERSDGNVGMDIGNAVVDTAKGVGNFMLGGAKNVIQDSVAGVIANMTEGTRKQAATQAMVTANSLIEQSQKEQDPTKRRELYDQAQGILKNISENAQNVSDTFSEDVEGNPFLRGIEAGAQIAGTAEFGANPAILKNMAKAPFQALRHPIDTVKATAEVVKHPIETVKTIAKNDWEQTKQGWNPFNQPAKPTMANGTAAIDEVVPDQTAPPQTPPTEPVPPQAAPTQSPALNESAVRDKLADEFSTALAVIDDGSVVKSQNTMREAMRMTKGADPRSVAIELESEVIPKAGAAIEKHIANLDNRIGLQPLDGESGALNQIMNKVRETTVGEANEDLVNILEKSLRKRLYAGDMGEGAMQQGFIEGTNFDKYNSTRKYLTSGKESWFRNGQPVGNRTNDLQAIQWEAAKAIKDIMSEADPDGIFKQMLHQQHIALQTYPVLSKEVLNRQPSRSIGGLVRRGYETARDRITLGTVERGTQTIPNIKIDDTVPPTPGGSATMVQNPPNNTPPIVSDPQAPSTSVGTGENLGGKNYVNTQTTRVVYDAKGKPAGLEKQNADGTWTPYKSSVRNFKKVDSAPKKSVNAGMSIDDATLQTAPAGGEPRSSYPRFEKDGRSLLDYNNDELTLDELQNKLVLANEGMEGRTAVREIEDAIDSRMGTATKTDMLPAEGANLKRESANLDPIEPADYDMRVRAYEDQGITRSDAQAIVDTELRTGNPSRRSPNAEDFVKDYKALDITSTGEDATIEYVAKKALNSGNYELARKSWADLPDGNKWKEGMRSLMEKSKK